MQDAPSTPQRAATDAAPTERAAIRELLAINVRPLDGRIEAAREDGLSGEDEALQLKRLRTLAQLARQYRLLARDADLDEMEAQVESLEHVIELSTEDG